MKNKIMSKLEIGDNIVFGIIIIVAMCIFGIVGFNNMDNESQVIKERAVIVQKDVQVMKVRFNDGTVKIEKMPSHYNIGDTVLVER